MCIYKSEIVLHHFTPESVKKKGDSSHNNFVCISVGVEIWNEDSLRKESEYFSFCLY